MAISFVQSDGSYDKKVEDSSKQASNKFSDYPKSAVKDDLPKPTHKGEGVKTVSEHRSRP